MDLFLPWFNSRAFRFTLLISWLPRPAWSGPGHHDDKEYWWEWRTVGRSACSGPWWANWCISAPKYLPQRPVTPEPITETAITYMGPNSTVQDCCIHEWIDHQTQNMTHQHPSHTRRTGWEGGGPWSARCGWTIKGRSTLNQDNAQNQHLQNFV